MNKQENLIIREITSEYISFMKNASTILTEVKRATVLTLKEVLKLEDGDQILINEDGSLEVEDARKGKKNYGGQ